MGLKIEDYKEDKELFRSETHFKSRITGKIEKRNGRNSGMGLGSVLFIVFLILKLVGVITWSWWWVTSPLWIGTILWILIVGGIIDYFKNK